ncbi:hypothetical protein EAb13_CDS0076 [Acinetobacter phage EAb13]|nr:hypothetical protein EAb13_CDS0076 [Acinetobacter phage EAb13]
MLEVNKLDSLEVPQPDSRQELSIHQMQFYKTQAKGYIDKSNELMKGIATDYIPKEIEIGKIYTCIKHPTDIASVFPHAPAMYAKLLKDNKLCLHYANADFENRECKVISISLYQISLELGLLRWEITVENPERKLFTALYATKISPSPYPKLTMDDVFILLAMSGLEAGNIGDNTIYIAKNVNGAVCTFVGSVPADWVVKGTPVIPEGVTTWVQFMSNPNSHMVNLDDKLFSLDEWLSYCNAT